MRRILAYGLVIVVCSCAGSGPAVWEHHFLAPMERDSAVPSKRSVSISLRAAPGESEPGVFAVRSDTPSSLSLKLKGAGRSALPANWCTVYHATSRTDTTALNRLVPLDGGTVETPGGRNEFFWLDVHLPEEAEPGVYAGRIEVVSEAGSSEIPVTLEVLPFYLDPSPVAGGAFMWLIDLPPGWYRDMKAHGMDAIQFFTWEWGLVDHEHDREHWVWDPEPIRIVNRDGNLELDFTVLDRIMEEMTAAGMQGPVAISLGNDHYLHYECRLALEFGLKIDTSEVIDGKRVIGPKVSGKLDELFMEGLRQIRSHWDGMGWEQELVVLIYDEPTERLLERCKNRYDLLKKVMPDTRVYGVVMNRHAWAESMLDQMDIIVANGDFEACRDLAIAHGKDYWVYSFPLRAVHTSRWDMGYLPWRVGASGTFFWMYNYWFYDPDNCAVYPHPDDPARVIPSPAWMGIREGGDDLRYLATLERMIEEAPADRKAAARAELNSIRESIDPARRRPALTGEQQDETSVLAHYTEPQKIRDRLIELILTLNVQE